MHDALEPQDELAIDALLRRYGDIATRQAWAEYAEIVLPDATIHFRFGDHEFDVVGDDGLAGLGAAATDAFAFYFYAPQHRLAWSTGEGSAAGRAYALETGETADGQWVDIYGAYDDEYRRVDGRWMIAGRRYRELRRRQRA